jgi:hypothetical protein
MSPLLNARQGRFEAAGRQVLLTLLCEFQQYGSNDVRKQKPTSG